VNVYYDIQIKTANTSWSIVYLMKMGKVKFNVRRCGLSHSVLW